MTGILLRRENLDTKAEGRQCKDKKIAIHEPSKEGGNIPSSHGPQKEPTLPTPWSCTSILQNWEKINFCSLSHSLMAALAETMLLLNHL